MKYFAKYLPVEGEIKKGDYYRSHAIDAEGIYKAGEDDKYGNGNKLPTQASEGRYKTKVKLFLCSRDIQVGDEFTTNQGLGYKEFKTGKVERIEGKKIWMEGESVYYDLDPLIEVENWFKVIGEISPEAIWVKEGDEFESDQIEKGYNSWTTGQQYRIKCSTCNTFH